MRNWCYLLIFLLCACGQKPEKQPLTGSAYGKLPNASAEEVDSVGVTAWKTDAWLKKAKHSCEAVAHEGEKSLCIMADSFAYGKWANKINLKPWSKYRFNGWVKSEEVVAEDKGGAGFRLGGVNADLKPLSGTNDWTLVTAEFETGANDCAEVWCLLGTEGEARGKVWFDDLSFELLSSEEIATNITVHPAVQKEAMSPYIYGQFIEHMGKCIYGGIWAEMLNDRKFWYAPGEQKSPWQVSGKEQTGALFYMDKVAPFTGEHTPVLVSEQNDVQLVQGGLGLRSGVGCSGYVILRADREMPVMVSLKSGEGQPEQVTLAVGREYQKFPVNFRVTRNTKEAQLAIAPQDKGKLWVGTVSLMPDDHVEGFRADVLALLKGLNAPVYRWPGGNFVSGYDWRDGIGDRDKRPPRKNPAWTGVEHNDVGIHEFMRLCELLETEPYIAVNAGLGGVEEAAHEVEYCNGESDSPMGRLRAEHGHAAPWTVKWWSVGNEMFGDWQLGYMKTEDFVRKHNTFADAMWAVDSSVKLIGVGNVGPWDEMIMANCADKMDLVSEHFYCQDWHGGGLMTHTLQIPRFIKSISDAHRKYREEIPGLASKDIRICMDEWNYWYGPHIYGELGTRYFLRDALGIAAGLNEFSRQSDMVFMANYAQTVNVIGCIKTNSTDATYAATGVVLKMYRDYFGTIPVELSGETRPFDVAATLNPDRRTLTLSVVNPTWEDVSFDLSVADDSFEIGGKQVKTGEGATVYTITGPDDMGYNEPGKADVVKTVSAVLKKRDKITVRSFSANIIEIPLADL